jgi:cyanophycinase-like exopeptidase
VVAAAAEHFDRLGATVEVASVWTRDDAFDPAVLPQVGDADLLYLSGGQVGYLAEALAGSPFADALLVAWRAGRPSAAASAGAVLLGSWVYDPEDEHAPLLGVDGQPGRPLRHEDLPAGRRASAA